MTYPRKDGHRRFLTPKGYKTPWDPSTYQRNEFQTHRCGNSDQAKDTCSNGCIAGRNYAVDMFNDLMDLEEGDNWLWVLGF